MGFGQAISEGFKNYFNFKGTALRSEFWYFYLFYVLLSILAATIDQAIFGQPTTNSYGVHSSGPLTIVVAFGLLIPYLSVAVRRLHDTGRRWYYLFISLIPLVGTIILIVWLAQKGTKAVSN